MPKGKQTPVALPEGWWARLRDLCRTWQKHETRDQRTKSRLDIYAFTKISRSSFDKAKKSSEMTEALFMKLADELSYDNYNALLRDLGAKGCTQAPTRVPSTLSLATRRANPQWADYRVYPVELARPWTLGCRIRADSPYFRFGFKLLTEEGRVFGDGVINSFDENLLVHVGRNNWDRVGLGIAAGDLFLTAYMSGSAIEDDRFLFNSQSALAVQIEITIDRSHFAILAVNGHECFRRNIPSGVCGRIALYAWGDREEFLVDVTDLLLNQSSRGGAES